MPTPTLPDSDLADLMSRGAAEAERFQAEMINLDAVWRDGTIDAYIQKQIDQARGRADVGSSDDSTG